MHQPIIYIDTSVIREGKLAELKAAMQKLSAFVKENMPGLISYGFYLNKEQTQMTVISVHPDSASLEFHMDKGKEEFRKFSEYIELYKMEVYGSVSDAVLDRLHQKVDMLGKGKVTVYDFYEGFVR